MALNTRKDPLGDSQWTKVPECDECNSTLFYTNAITWSEVAADSGWTINARTGSVTCKICDVEESK